MKKGIDISYHQGAIDFSKVKKCGIDFVILRSSYRKTTDTRFFEYVKKCKAVNLPIIGVYHFIYALSETQALAEAQFCVSQVKKAGLGKDIYIFADFEGDTVLKAKKAGVTLGKSECNKFTEIFCNYVKSQGYKPGIYANGDYYKNWYSKDLLSKYPIWLADYEGGPDFACIIQQFTDSGRIAGINGNVDMNHWYGESTGNVKVRSRQAVVDLICSWEGLNEADGSYKKIVDIYNSYTGTFPRRVKMKYGWAWCACTWSAAAIKLGYTDIMPIEIGCEELINRAKKMGCWVEADDYVPSIGDAALYDWDDNGIGDCTGYADHIGTIVEVHKSLGYSVAMEGNYKDAVRRRKLAINGRYIRGYITPKYTDNTISYVPPSKTDTTVKSERSGYMFNPEVVKNGCKGTSVLLVQEILKSRGFKGSDGKDLSLDREAGSNTIYAIKQYQKSRGLTVDGVCGTNTWKDLIAI